MKIVIIKQNTKQGTRYYPYRKGLLSRLGIFSMFNKIGFCGGDTVEECIKNTKSYLVPDPPQNTQVVKEVEM